MLTKFNNSYKTSIGKHILKLVSLLWASSPLLIKLYLGMQIWSSSNIMDTMAFYMNMITCYLLFWVTNLFFFQAYKDIERTVYFMYQMSQLIATHNRPRDPAKLYPTLNFLEAISINSWKILRRISVDYGKKYFHRHEIYLPVVFAIAGASFFGIFAI